MRILIVQPTCDKRGHYGIWTVKLCQALGRKGHEVILCTNNVYPDKYLQEKPIFHIFKVGNGKYSFKKFDEAASKASLHYYYGYFRNTYAITSAALEFSKKEAFDGIFITDAEFMISSLLLKRYRIDIPVVMQVNAANFSYKTYSGSHLKKMYKVFQREIFKLTLGKEIKAFAVLGEWHKERLRDQLGLTNNFPIAVIPDGGEEPIETFLKSEARKKLGVNFDGPIFLFFGMLRKDKGIEYLLEALSFLSDSNFKLMIVGAPMEYKKIQIRSMLQQTKSLDKVILDLRYVDDHEVPLYFSACDILVLPYPKIYAGGSGPLMKGACTYGRPVIVTDVSEMGRLVKRCRIGLVAEPESPKSIAGKMKEFLSLSEEKRGEMARNAFNLAKANSWDAMADRFTELYETILQQR